MTVVRPDCVEILMQTPGSGMGEPCSNCGEPSSGFHGLPWFNGDLVSNDWKGEWGGQQCCEDCFHRHERGELKTYDHLYQYLLDGYTFGDGAGI